jgi:hypothetical protein
MMGRLREVRLLIWPLVAWYTYQVLMTSDSSIQIILTVIASIIWETAMMVSLREGFRIYVVKMGSNDMTYTPHFINTGSGVYILLWGDTQTAKWSHFHFYRIRPVGKNYTYMLAGLSGNLLNSSYMKDGRTKTFINLFHSDFTPSPNIAHSGL